MINAFPLIVHVVLDVDLAVNHRTHHINEKEGRDRGEYKAYKVSRQTNIDLTISLKTAEGVPKTAVVWYGREGSLFFAEAWDIQIDTCAQFGFQLKPLDHRNDLTLLFVRSRVVRPNLA